MKVNYDGSDCAMSFTMTRPDDWHLHLRDGKAMEDVVHHSARQFGRAIIMPNLKPPVTTAEQARDYSDRIRSVLLARAQISGKYFLPLMTLYLTDNTSPDEIARAKQSGFVFAVKYYPAGATTNSDFGVTDIEKVYPVLEKMQEVGMVLCVHGEVTDPSVDVFDREKVFVDTVLVPLVAKFPGLKIVLEHITTEYGALYVEGAGPSIAATITAHHLLENRNALFRGGICPHNYCLPILKREGDRKALLRAAVSRSPKFFLGTDSAPHAKGTKENACGCAGCFTAPYAVELYAEAFDSIDMVHRLEGFASHFGADFYGLLRNTDTVTFVRDDVVVPAELPFGDSVVVPFRAGGKVKWKMK